MSWGEFKNIVDAKITDELGDKFISDEIQIDWLDIGTMSTPYVVIIKYGLMNLH